MNKNKKEYYDLLKLDEGENVLVAACHVFFNEQVEDAEFDEDDEFYHYDKYDFVFKDYAMRPAELLDIYGGEMPRYYFDSFEELKEFDLDETALILTRKNYYWNDDDCDEEDKESLHKFNEDFGTNFSSFGECWDYVLDQERSEENFVVNVFRGGEIL